MPITHADIRAYLGLLPGAWRIFEEAGVPKDGPLTASQVEAVVSLYRQREGERLLWASQNDAKALRARLEALRKR